MFQPDYRNLEACARNQRPARIPLYEHNINAGVMERITGEKFVESYFQESPDYEAFFRRYNAFFRDFGYDTVTFEACVNEILPMGGALGGSRPGCIDGREAFERYPFDRVPKIYIDWFKPKLDAIRRTMPDGMLAVGGVGNGVFEVVQDLVGYQNLCILFYDDPELCRELFARAGDMLVSIWQWFLAEYSDLYCVCRFGDDLGFRSSTLLAPDVIREYILPVYKRIVALVHEAGKPFLLHSCGCIFSVMEDLIEEVGIDAKHSNEDQIAPMREWVERYGDRIGNFGGIDTDHLVRMEDSELARTVTEVYRLAEAKNGGFAIGSGNSIPEYICDEKYLLMINTVRALRGDKV